MKPGASIKTQLDKAAHSGLTRALSLPDSTAIVVGIVIGAGIFLIPRLVAQATPSIPTILCMWVLGGVVCFLGALGYAELGALMPVSGGHYVYLREMYTSANAMGRCGAFSADGLLRWWWPGPPSLGWR